jgi:hypothetical protein
MNDSAPADLSDLKRAMERALTLVSKYTGLMESIPQEIVETIQMREFILHEEPPPDLIAVDGSYSFILNVSSVWIVILRIGALHYEFKEDSDQIGYALKRSYLEERPEVIASFRQIVEQQTEVHQELFNIATTSGRQTHLTIADGLRRLAEDKLAGDLAGKVKNAIIALDGALTTQPFPQFQAALRNVIERCEKNNNILIGVSKDSKTHAFNSYRTDEELLNMTQQTPGLAFVRAPRRFEKAYSPPLWGDVYFAHLSPLAPKWFRIDVGTRKDDPHYVFSNLAHYARSEICPGYLFPLIEAHRYVVTVRHFHQVYEDLVFELGPQYGLDPSEIALARTNIEGRRLGAFHEFLDRFSRR